MTSRQGQILIASRLLLDPNFVKTVVLIVQHGEDGVVGLILNRSLAALALAVPVVDTHRSTPIGPAIERSLSSGADSS